MNADQYIIATVTADGKNYVYWVVDGQSNPVEPPNAKGNRTTSSSTLGTAIAAEMPTLST